MYRWARHRLVAVALVLLGLATVELVAGCHLPGAATAKPQATPSAPADPSASPIIDPSSPPPAAIAGGACLLMDFKVINKALGSHFNVAAAATSGETYTCDLRTSTAAYPDLSMAITATDLQTKEFTADVTPKGSKSVTKLGKIGYIEQVAATSSVGPAVEVGWLSGNDRLIVLRYTFATDASVDDATALADKMTSLARTVDGTTV